MQLFKNTLVFIALLLALCAKGQDKLQVGICLQDASSLFHIIDAQIIVNQLDSNNKFVSADTLKSNIYAPLVMNAGQVYRFRISKTGYQQLDTSFAVHKTSRSRRKRIGFLLFPEICHYLSATIIDADNQRNIKKGQVVVSNQQDSILQRFSLQDGGFNYCATCGKAYRIRAFVEGYFEDTRLVEIPTESCHKTTSTALSLRIALQPNYSTSFFDGATQTIEQPLFESKSTVLAHHGKQELRRMIRVLNRYPDLRIHINIQASVYNDSRLNRRLAEQRARKLENHLTRAGVLQTRYFLKCVGTSKKSIKSQLLRLKTINS